MKNSLYDFNLLSEKIEDLRKRNGKDKITLDKLSEEILKETGVYISRDTLGKYEREGEAEKMRIGNLVTIANYYRVSLDYLFGITESKSTDYKERLASKKFGLSTKALNILNKMAINKDNENQFKLKLINYMLENDTLIDELTIALLKYYKAQDNKMQIKDEMKEKYNISTLDITKASLNEVFRKYRDDSYNKLWDTEHMYLFDMSKKPKSKKRRKNK